MSPIADPAHAGRRAFLDAVDRGEGGFASTGDGYPDVVDLDAVVDTGPAPGEDESITGESRIEPAPDHPEDDEDGDDTVDDVDEVDTGDEDIDPDEAEDAAVEVSTDQEPDDIDLAPPPPSGGNTTPARFSKPIMAAFIGGVAVIAIILAAVMIGMRPAPTVDADPTDSPRPALVVVPSAAPTIPAAAINADASVPYTASADCPTGSTPAQSVASTDPTQAWVCVRNGVDGQVLTLDLGKPTMVTGIGITPGWVGTDASGADQWLAHRVVTHVDWILMIGDQVTADIPWDTKNAHGETITPVTSDIPGRGVLAARIVMLVKQTSRPPVQTATTTTTDTPGAFPDLMGGVTGEALPGIAPTDTATEPGAEDPADSTFAVSSIRVIGHAP